MESKEICDLVVITFFLKKNYYLCFSFVSFFFYVEGESGAEFNQLHDWKCSHFSALLSPATCAHTHTERHMSGCFSLHCTHKNDGLGICFICISFCGVFLLFHKPLIIVMFLPALRRRTPWSRHSQCRGVSLSWLKQP